MTITEDVTVQRAQDVTKELIWPSWGCSDLKGFQLSRIFWDCPEIKHHLLKSRNTINLSRIKAFSSTLEENPKFLFFHSPKLFVYKLPSFSTSSSTIFKCFKSRRWCLLKNSPSSVFFYLHNLILRSYSFKNRTCTKILIICKNRF